MKQKSSGNTIKKSHSKQTALTGTVRIPLPWLWPALLAILIYAGSLDFGFTELDDTIFILETREYNKDLSNFFHSFTRGVFNETNDTYYRPLLLNSFILDYQLTGIKEKGYHLTNLFLHVLAVCLLYFNLSLLLKNSFNAFLLTTLFAVHPVLCQAVVWIPGRNDSLLSVFSLLCMMTAIRYIDKGNLYFLFIQAVCLLAALFTKETAVFIAPGVLILIMTCKNISWRDRNVWLLGTSWILVLIIWFFVRSQATLQNEPLQVATLLSGLINRSLILIQYLGKIFIPVNLSVFPMLEETSNIPGLISILLLTVIIFFAKNRNNRIIVAGFAFYILLLLPVVLLPASLNNQDFEHRVYLPVTGLLLVLSETVLFKNLKPLHTGIITAVIVVLLSIINISHQQHFKNALSFWTAAVETTPKSSYANMMLAARLDKTNPEGALQMMLKARQLNPKEKYVNYYLGKMYADRDSFSLAEKFLKDELNGSAYYETYFYLSRVAFEKQNVPESMRFMELYLEKDPSNSQAINNYILMLLQTNQKDKAKEFIHDKQLKGIPVPGELLQQLK